MNTRVKLLVESYGLSKTDLAKKLDVTSGSLTHLISGRNKPSVEFLEKLLKFDPKINIEWLITGKGDRLKQQKPNFQSELKIIIQKIEQKAHHLVNHSNDLISIINQLKDVGDKMSQIHCNQL